VGAVIERSELHDAAQKAFPSDALKPDRDESWKLITEMGWLMLSLSEEAGGLGLGRDAAAAIHFEHGKALGTAPLIPAMATVQALGAATELADQAGWIERASAGEFITTNLRVGTVTGASSGGDEVLSGTLPAVPDADMASHVMIANPGRAALVPLDAPGVTVTERPLWDQSRRLFDVTLDSYAIDPALVMARGGEAQKLTGQLKAEMIFALAADSLGGANTMLNLTVEYLNTRKQFDRPLGMFQALQHRCADLKVLIGAAEALLWARAVRPDATMVESGGLKTHAAEVYRWVCEEAIQLHGGVGLTEEFYCHLFMKRANLNVQIGGDADMWREMVGREALEAAG
jgi:alkylation response protein AidB-like acyl-CoA dehydrogenase